MTLFAEVALPLPLDQIFTYSIPRETENKVQKGVRVLVPFGARTMTGFVVSIRKKGVKKDIQLKDIQEVLDEAPLFAPSFLSFTRKLSRYYFTSWGEILQASVPPSFLLQSKALVSLTEKGKQALENQSLEETEKKVVLALSQKSYRSRFLQRKYGVPPSLLARMEKKGLISVEKQVRKIQRRKVGEKTSSAKQLELDFSLAGKSRQVADRLGREIEKGSSSRFLLHGPAVRRETVYFHLIKEALSGGGKVLYLVPEIALSRSLVDKLEKRLGERVAVLHSQLTEKRREMEWQKIRDGHADVVVGPRSALFSPLEKLRLIIVDDEHDESYGQQENFTYDARKGAWLRAREEQATLIYGSETPSVEAYYRAKRDGYLVSLESEAWQKKVSVVDSRKDTSLVCRPLKEAISKRLEKKERTLLFFNRRGYAAFMVCSRCGYVPRCSRCDLGLSFHKQEDRLVCHSCGQFTAKLEVCPRCGNHFIQKRGPGIEAVAEDLRRHFPSIRIGIFTADEAGRETERRALLLAFEKGDVDILLGTQLLASQVGIPAVTLIGILHPETILNRADFRSGEKTFQAVLRACGFLAEGEGTEAVIQTSAPGHFSIREASRGDFHFFYHQEVKFRRLMGYPPFSHLIEIILQGRNPRQLAGQARHLAALIKNSGEKIEVMGPSFPAMPRLREQVRVQVSLKARRKETLDRILPESLKGIRVKKTIFVYN